MEAFASLLSLLALAGAWWWVNRYGKKRGWHFVGRQLLGAATGFAAMILIVAALIPAVPAPEQQQVNETPVGAEAAPVPRAEDPEPAKENPAKLDAKRVATLGMTFDEYVDRLRREAKKSGVALAVMAGEVQEGQVNDVAQIAIGQHAAIVVSLDKISKEATGIITIVQGDGTPLSGAQALAVGMASIGAASKPELHDQTLNKLGGLVTSHDDETLSAKIGDLEISFGISELGGIFTASAVEEEGADA